MQGIKAFTMPKWGIEMTEGRIADWFVGEGVPFAKGTMLAAIESDKITNEVEAEADGRFARVLAVAGETYPVGALLAVLADESVGKDKVEAFIASFKGIASSSDEDAAPSPAVKADPAPAAVVIPADAKISPAARAGAVAGGVDVTQIAGTGRNGRITAQDVHQAAKPSGAPALKGVIAPGPANDVFASPMAKRLAHMHNVPLAGIAGTGPRGRIRKADVLSFVQKPVFAGPPGEIEIETMSPIRKAIARRLTEAKSTIPHFYLRRRVRVDKLLALRAAGGNQFSVNDYLVRACALALMEVRDVNIQVHGDAIHRFPQADISVAVATDRGLTTPIVFGAERLTVGEISAAVKSLAERARAGKLKLEEITGGSFSLSNLGAYGVEQFDAIINPPQGAILAVGKARPEPFEDGGAIRLAPVMHMSLSCDHRAIDGAVGAKFLSALVDLIETPERL